MNAPSSVNKRPNRYEMSRIVLIIKQLMEAHRMKNVYHSVSPVSKYRIPFHNFLRFMLLITSYLPYYSSNWTNNRTSLIYQTNVSYLTGGRAIYHSAYWWRMTGSGAWLTFFFLPPPVTRIRMGRLPCQYLITDQFICFN